jgi:nucleotide-binding universal stress UspA family protein
MKTDPILVAIDLAGSSTEVVQAAASLAARLGSRVVLLTVVSPAAGVNPFAEGPDGKRHDQTLDEDAFRDLEPYVALLQRDGVHVEKDLAHGDPTRGILEAVRRHDPGFVVMGTHGRQGLARAFYGSVADAVLRQTSVPVMVVRSPAAGLDPTE